MQVVLDWEISAFFGWGVYGLNLGLELPRYPDIAARTAMPLDSRQIGVDALRLRVLAPILARSNAGAPAHDAVWLHALGNEFRHDRIGQARIGIAFFEAPLSAGAIERAKRYEFIVTGSSWNESVLRAAGLKNIRTILQGVDRSLFFPGPKRNLFPGCFLIFSGGKAEPRKGQDIVVAAFRIFARRHKEAMLVTAWHSPWPDLARGMDLDLSEFAGRVIDVGPLPNVVMGPIYRECDVGLFPNRAEGGTNLVAMECLACGVPAILSDNTGHRDLLRMGFGHPLRQRPGAAWSEWGESDVEDVVEALEHVYANPQAHKKTPELPQWSDSTDALVRLVRYVH
ncbi:MAG TPA: glycosyltransferase family 4 protein [Rhizomicrobium sp.]|jgi:glycosyltransferase involved in cell wall biosynthesis|nr:glycosyltransferase family 4 protein [Rhizomicrobium sp.]